ncbi:MAG: sulfatase-like hydrolase/transferase [Caldilineaceae bacterium]
MTRRQFLTYAGMTLVGSSLRTIRNSNPLIFSPLDRVVPVPGKQPNIVLIITDQERYPRHWPADWAVNHLPAHQRLLANSLSFRRFFCNAAMCSPSRATLLTGLHPMQHGVTRTLTVGGSESPKETPLAHSMQTLGHMLASAGYDVTLKGKFHITKHEDGGEPTSDDAASLGFQGWEPTTIANDAAVENFAGGCADWDRKVTDQAVNYLSGQQSPSKPFMLIVGLGNPHDVLAFPRSWDAVDSTTGCDNYTGFDFDQGISLPPTLDENLDTKPTCQAQSLNVYAVGLGAVTTTQLKRNYVNFYAGLMKQSDALLGELLDAIPAAIRDNTIVIYTSDHGEMGLSHGGLRQKMFNMYEETVNIPLIIHNAKLFPQPKVTDAYGSLIDLLPTLASIVEVPHSERWMTYGHDLTPILTNSASSVQNEILFTFDDDQIGQADGIPQVGGQPMVTYPYYIRGIIAKDSDGEWKYARYFDPTGIKADQLEMYHLLDGSGVAVDPNETDNLANPASANYNNPTYAAKRSNLAQRLANLEAERLQPLSNVYLPLLAS